MPDITLLSPIVRLLNVTLDTLLSHTDSLSDDEANQFILAAHEKLKTEPFETVFSWAKDLLPTYPNSAFLTLYMARVLHSHLQMLENDDDSEYSSYFVICYERALESEDEGIKKSAADALYCHYMGCEQFKKAEEYLDYFSPENPERKRKLASIYRKTGRKDEATQMYEELLYSGYMSIQSTFHDIYYAALTDEDFEKAHQIVQKLRLLAQLFEMGEYHEFSPGLELAIKEQDADTLFEIMQRLLGNIESIFGFTKSTLFTHMPFKQQPNEAYYNEMRQTLLDCLNDKQCI